MRFMKLITILLMAFALKSCGNSKATTNIQDDMEMNQTEILSGTYNITLVGNNKDLPENIHLNFDETKNRVSGFAGCNNFSGDYNIDGDIIKFGALMSTKMFCKRFMDIEQHVLKALEQTNTFSIKDNTLNLRNGESILIEAIKSRNERMVQDDDYTIEYTATTRGFYTQVIIKNGTLSIQKDRDHNAPIETIVCSEEELKALNTLLKEIDLEKLSIYEGPTKKRLYDGAAIANLKITWSGNDYSTPSFDHGYPNSNIEAFVNTITSMAKMPN